MFTISSTGRPIARVIGPNNKLIDILSLKTEDNKPCCKKCSKKCIKKKCCRGCNMCCLDKDKDTSEEFILKDGYKLEPIMNPDERSVNYIAGPSGSGKSTYAAGLITGYRKMHPEKEFFIFSRTDAMNDPALKSLGGSQIEISEKLITDPINIEQELSGGSLLLFDDCNTIQNPKFKKAIDDLMSDIMEVGRKLDISIIITNHLVIPNERKFARTILNEIQTITFFPKSGSSYQISYALKKYFGITQKQIDKIIHLPSRWVTVSKTYPMYVLYEKGAYLIN